MKAQRCQGEVERLFAVLCWIDTTTFEKKMQHGDGGWKETTTGPAGPKLLKRIRGVGGQIYPPPPAASGGLQYHRITGL